MILQHTDSRGYKHLFIGSSLPRSGSTLLELVLSAHSLISITPEASCIATLIREDMRKGNHNCIDIRHIYDLMKSDSKLNGWPRFSLDDFFDHNLALRENLTTKEILESLFEHYACLFEKKPLYLGNKKGFYATELGPAVKRIFPDAKFIYIYRDPRDAVNSTIKNIEGYDLTRALCEINFRDYHIKRMLHEFPQDSLIIRYEDLVTEPEQTSKRICEFLGINFDHTMLEFYKLNASGSKLIGSTLHLHQNTQRNFDRKLIGQWKQSAALSNETMMLIEKTCQGVMRDLNYDPGFCGVMPLEYWPEYANILLRSRLRIIKSRLGKPASKS